MKWREFRDAAEELAEPAEKLFEKSGVLLLGTVRKDGSPRISPVEPLIVDGELMRGMMWRSYKALDLLRDPRCTIHSTVADRMAADGEFKAHGCARDVRDAKTCKRYGDELKKKIGWAPNEPNFHLFAVEVHSAGFFTNEKDARVIHRWRVGGSVERRRQTMDEINPPEASGSPAKSNDKT